MGEVVRNRFLERTVPLTLMRLSEGPPIKVIENGEPHWFVRVRNLPKFTTNRLYARDQTALDAASQKYNPLLKYFRGSHYVMGGGGFIPQENEFVDVSLNAEQVPLMVLHDKKPVQRNPKLQVLTAETPHHYFLSTKIQAPGDVFDLEDKSPVGVSRLLLDPSVYIYLGVVDGYAVATATAVCRGYEAIIWGTATLPSFRKQGLATTLVDSLVTDLMQTGIEQVSLFSSQAGLNVYKGLGFEVDSYVSSFFIRPKPEAGK